MRFFRKKEKKKKKKVKVIYARMCPKCESVNVTMGKRRLEAIGLPMLYQCLDCGFQNYNFPEVRVEIDKDKEKKLKNKKND